MRWLCFGGSFNPIHHGHLICARAVAEAAGFDRIVLIPTATPPHKPSSSDLVAAEHRLAMCRLAAEAQPGLFEVSDIELTRTGPSFTIDTVRQLKTLGWTDVYWLIGADMLLYLQKWHQSELLLREARFIVMQRPGFTINWTRIPAAHQVLRESVYPAPLIEVSATEIRQRVLQGRSVEYLVPGAVARYIEAHRLYKAAPNAPTGGNRT